MPPDSPASQTDAHNTPPVSPLLLDDNQQQEIYHEGYEQKCYEIGECDPDYPIYTQDDIDEAIDDARNEGIEETLNYTTEID